jgi:hypothetical protein
MKTVFDRVAVGGGIRWQWRSMDSAMDDDDEAAAAGAKRGRMQQSNRGRVYPLSSRSGAGKLGTGEVRGEIGRRDKAARGGG